MTDWMKEAQRVAESAFLGKGPDTPSIIDAIATALREAHRKGEEWRPIAEAPRDGTYVELRFPGPFHDTESKGVAIGRYYDKDGGYWWVTCIWAGSRADQEPTHFRSLPLSGGGSEGDR